MNTKKVYFIFVISFNLLIDVILRILFFQNVITLLDSEDERPRKIPKSRTVTTNDVSVRTLVLLFFLNAKELFFHINSANSD